MRCTDPNCRTYKQITGKDFCAACKGRFAMKYQTPRKGAKTKPFRYICDVEDNQCFSPIEITDMLEHSRIISWQTFLQYVPLRYINAMFGYTISWKEGRRFRDDRTITLYKSTIGSHAVLWMLRNDDGKERKLIFAPKDWKPMLLQKPALNTMKINADLVGSGKDSRGMVHGVKDLNLTDVFTKGSGS